MGLTCTSGIIRNGRKLYEHHYNTFYAERPETGIKYTYNSGHPNIDNPKLTARHFLNAIDRVDSLKEKYEKTLKELDKEIPMVEQIIAKPFEKEQELADMKTKLASLEREINLKIQEKLLLERAQTTAELPESKQEATKEANTLVIKLEPKQAPVNSLQPAFIINAPVVNREKRKGFRM